MRIKKKKKMLLTNYHNKLFTMNDTYDKDLESLFCEWEVLEMENNNLKRIEAINIFLVFICYMLKNNKLINKNNKLVENNKLIKETNIDFDIDSID